MQIESTQDVKTGSDVAVDDAVAEVNAGDDDAADVTETDSDDAVDSADADPSTENEKLKKALRKKNRYTDNLRSRLRALEAEHEKLKSQSFTKEAPKMEGFESVLDYMKAENQHMLEKYTSEAEQKMKLSAVEQQKTAIRAQQDQRFEAGINQIVSASPENMSVITEAMPIFQSMPKHIEDFLYEIDDAPAAVFALAREGRLEDVFYMHPQIAATELVNAQARGQRYLQEKPSGSSVQASVPQSAQATTVQPHKPLAGVRGQGKSSQKLSEMSPDDLVKIFIK